MVEKRKPEGVPPVNKRSMVSEADLEVQEVPQEEQKIPDELAVLMGSFQLLQNMDKNITTLVELFGKAKDAPKTKVIQSPLEIAKTENNTSAIADAFSVVGDMVTIDEQSSAQYVLVRPTRFLGKEDFAKLGAISRELGGTYVSQGKESHFKIPKLTEKTDDTPTESAEPVKVKQSNVDDIRMMFPENLETLLAFEEKGDYVKISPRQFLGSDNFAKIASIVRGCDGDYISAGKASHFRIPKK